MRAAIVANRTFERAQSLASLYGATAVHYDAAWSALPDVDVRPGLPERAGEEIDALALRRHGVDGRRLAGGVADPAAQVEPALAGGDDGVERDRA